MIFSTAFIVFASTLLASTTSALTRTFQRIRNPRLSAQTAQQCDMTYALGAPVMTNPLTIHYVYYGNWTNNQKTIVQDFTKGLGKSSWYGITTQYYYQKNAKSPKVYISNSVTLGKTVNDTKYSIGKSISDTNLFPTLIQNLVTAKSLPEDTNALYVVLTSPDVSHLFDDGTGNTIGFCNTICGYHSSAVMKSGKKLPYAFVGNGAACPDVCIPMVNHNASPNGDLGVDGLVSILAHEISEAVIEPYPIDVRSWYDCNGDENADKCDWNFGNVTKLPNKSVYNTQIGNRKFLIQQNWNLKTKSCALA